jgi:Mrp family chromosome partitioning ATPase
MEKLQKALQKARQQRNESVGAASVSTPMADNLLATAGSEPAGNDEWTKLMPFEPDRKLLDRHHIVSLSATEKATPFDILRTKAQLLMQKNDWTRLGITSPTPACGKTTTAANLALGFTRQNDQRVILVELDLRRPSMAKLLGHKPAHDVTSMLNGIIPFSDQAIRVRDNLAISMACQAATDPTSILLSHKTHETLAEIEATYAPDLMIFDLPPVLMSDDARAFLKHLDCGLIMAKAEETSIAQIDACEREVAEQTNVLGVVLNQCRHVGDVGYSYESYS